MRVTTRRRLDMVLLTLGAVGAGVVAAIGAGVGDSERVSAMSVAAAVDRDGNGYVTEVIDYDFGPQARRGIYRDVPGLDAAAAVEVESPTAPDDVLLLPSGSQTRIRVGDPLTTITGRHRYRLSYPLVAMEAQNRVAWNAVGTEWQAPVESATIHLAAPWVLEAVRCDRGTSGAIGGCEVEQPEPGRLFARVHDLDPGEGVTISGVATTPLEITPRLPALPDGPATDPGSGLALPAIVAAVAALVASGPASRLVRRRGRELVVEGGAADVAYATGPRVRRVDHEELASYATIEFAPPEQLTPSRGGVLLAERVTGDHKVAWLVEAAGRGVVDLDEANGSVVLRRGARDQSFDWLLDRAFAGRSELELGEYDAAFSAAWDELGDELTRWQRTSGLWSPRSEVMARTARVVGALGVVITGALLFASGAAANRWGSAFLVAVAVAAAGVGASIAALVRGWELRVRTPEGSALWLRVESFRRFLGESEAYHADQAAERGVLREYTAWAVAVGEIDRWSRAVAASSLAPQHVDTVRMATIAPRLGRATSAAATKPSSSGSGGGGGGGVGSGSGGGGGGSW